MTKRPDALASALKKISGDPWIEAVEREDVAQMFIDHPTKKKNKSRVSLDGRTKPLVPEFTIKGAMQDQLDQMARALRQRLADG